MGTATRVHSSADRRGDRGGRDHGRRAADRNAAAPSSGVRRPAPASTVVRAENRTHRIGPVQLQQLVLIELALAAVLVAAAVDMLLLVPAVVVAVALVLLAVLRRRRLSVRDWLATVLALRARTSAARPLDQRVDPSLAPAAEAVPGLRTYGYLDRDRRTVGMVGDGTFLTAVVRVEAKGSALRPPGGARALPLTLLHDALDVDGIKLESVQVVQHVQPAPAPHLPEHAVARQSYAPLQQQTGAPALRLMWVALKLDPELCREAVEARGGGLPGAQRCLTRVTDHLASRLTGAGFLATVLDEQELIAALATSACANPVATARAGLPDAAPARRTQESSRVWKCDDRLHTTYGVGRWPELGRSATPLPRLASVLTSVPALASTFSLTVTAGDRHGAAGVSGHVRLTGRSDAELSRARQRLEAAAREMKLGLVRLDREQLPGAVATLPLGGAR
ncbi:type VII secretion protein EccE [Streptomyces purpurogeneiscleroticus]|uniref:type VII secretion protein EccE n=1 Tax=Streptomyces purpurogeneiscleroticus TaxID=68259 RepID=UPI0035569D0D|nr:type VII secretion protein EccE [Streptomyces purpurogeneiscleroticus]